MRDQSKGRPTGGVIQFRRREQVGGELDAGALPKGATLITRKTRAEQARIKNKLMARLIAEGWTEARAEEEAESCRFVGCLVRGEFVFPAKASARLRRERLRVIAERQSIVAEYERLWGSVDHEALSHEAYAAIRRAATLLADGIGEDPAKAFAPLNQRRRKGGKR